ncbi:MAG TPA: NAD(P)-binding protein, partial [Quisquiliibacterium sp.]|nr:NAD(P)-binding protein [Quisquiliibacterium sp.]
ANVAIAAAARLLAPRVPLLARAHTARAADSLHAFDSDHVIDPFTTFARHLALAMRAPGCYRLHDWLTAPPDSELQKEHEPPAGTWLVCGYGRFGRSIREALVAQGATIRIIDPAGPADADDPVIAGVGTEREVLDRAGVAAADGLVAGTDDDIANLAILAMARELNPRLFTVARQNEAVNQALFERIRANLVMRPSEIIAEEALARLTTPLLDRFLDALRDKDDAWGDLAIHQLRKRIGTRAPKTWTITVDSNDSPALVDTLADGQHPVTLDDLLRDPRNRDAQLPARALLLLRSGAQTLLPGDETVLVPGDRILLAGRGEARRLLALALRDVNVLEYLCTGRDLPGGWVWKKFARG